MSQDPTPESSVARSPHRLRWRHGAYFIIIVVVIAAAVIGGALWYASRPQFAARVRRTVVATLERTTGGKVDIGSFQWSVRRLAIQVNDLTVHGKEGPGEAPYFHVDRLTLRAKILSFFTPTIALASLSAQHPVFHLILYRDGTTNQPQPRHASGKPLSEVLLHLAVDRTRVENGVVLLNDRRIPWEMAAGPLQLTVRYLADEKEYHSQIKTKNITFRLKNATEAHSELTASVNLGRDQVKLESLDLKTGNSRLFVTGQLRNFSQPAWQVAVRGTLDARQVGAITGESQLRDGVAGLNIHAHGAPASTGEKFQVTGHVDLRHGAWQAPWLRLSNVELHTNLIVNNDQCSLTNFSSLLDDGGRISGSLIMKHCVGPSAPTISAVVRPVSKRSGARKKSWLAAHIEISPRELLRRLHRKRPAHPEGAAPVYEPLQASMDAHVENVTLPLILKATAPRQYWDIGFTTATSGEVTAHWSGEGHGLDVHGNLTMHAPRHLMGLIPVTGSAHADYLGDHHHLVMEQVDETTPGTHVHAAGLLTLHPSDLNSDLRMDVVGDNMGEFDRLLTDLDLWETPRGQPHALPVQLDGSAHFHGDIRGSYFALEAMGTMDAQRFQMILARAAPLGHPQSAPPVRRLTWDAFHAQFSYTPWELIVQNAELLRGRSAIHTAFDLQPDHKAAHRFSYDKRTHITASLEIRNASVADLLSVPEISYPASGELNANAHASGPIDALAGGGHFTLIRGVVDGQVIPEASILLSLEGDTLTANHIQMAAAGGSAEGHLSYDYRTGALEGQLTGKHLQLNQVSALQSRHFAVGGTLGFHLQAVGTGASPAATAAMEIDSLKLNREAMGTMRAEAHLQNRLLTITSRADLLKTHLDAAGQVQLSGNYPAQAHLSFVGFNVEPLLRMTSASGTYATSSIDGTIVLAGPLKQLSAIRADADLKTFRGTIERRPIHSTGPVELSLRDGIVQLKRVQLKGRDTDLIAYGTVDLLRQYRLRLHAEGSIDVGLISVFDPNIQSSGELGFVVTARGTAAQPDLRGRARVRDVNVHIRNVTNGLTGMNGEMVFDQDRLVVEHLEGSSGGGQLQVKGFVGYRNGAFVDLTATTKDVRIRYPKGVSSSVDSKLRLLGTSDSLLLSGSMQLTRFGIGSSVDLSALAGSGGVSAPIDPSSPLNRIRLDIHVTSAPQLGFQNSFASLAGDVNLRLRGTLENPSVLGRIDITEGSASFAGTKYQLQQGDIVFNNPVTISPEIDLEATARVQNYDIIISLHGPPSKLDISYRSEPPLTQADVLALLALGRTNEQAAQYGEQQQAGANLTSEALLGGALNAAVSSRVQKLFGVGSVRVDPNFVGTLGESTARVTVEEQVGRRLTLTFATNVNTTAQQLIQGQYDLTRNVSIIAVRDEADVFSMYLQIRAKHK